MYRQRTRKKMKIRFHDPVASNDDMLYQLSSVIKN